MRYLRNIHIIEIASYQLIFSLNKRIVVNSGIFLFVLPQGVRTPILQLSAMQEGDYTFQLTVTDSSGQQDTAQVTVIVQPGKPLDI